MKGSKNNSEYLQIVVIISQKINLKGQRTMDKEAVLVQLGYTPNEALLEQLEKIEKNTHGYEKIIKHVIDLHNALKVDGSYVAMSNTNDHFKIKVGEVSPEIVKEAFEKIEHFSDKYKVMIIKVKGKDTFYVIGFQD